MVTPKSLWLPAHQLALIAAIFASGYGFGQAREPLIAVQALFATSKTVMDEPIVYPANAAAKLTAAILTIQPGGETGWHTHGVPLVGMVLDGDLTVDYRDQGPRTYHAGEAFAEAMSVPHNGHNDGNVPVRLIALYIGAEGVAPTVAEPISDPH